MKNFILILSIIILGSKIFGQSSIQTKEIKIVSPDALEIFHICNSGCVTTFLDTKNYYWYTEFSMIKSTEGSSGGSLLHGNYKLYDGKGNLRQERNFKQGLLDGSEKNWDEYGNITSQYKYSNGESTYMKFRNDEKKWIEIIGVIFKEGTVTKVYTQYDILIQEEEILSNSLKKYRNYYENTGIIKDEYTISKFPYSCFIGQFTTYYENGYTQVAGHFEDFEYFSIRRGIWNWYHSDGTLKESFNYKSEITKWPNGKIKSAGGYIQDPTSKEWILEGEWRTYDETGAWASSIKYEWGVVTSTE